MASEATLYARMELRLNEAEKKLAKFQGNVDKNMSGIERRTQKAARTMETSLTSSASKITSVFKTFGSGLLAGVVAGGIGGVVASLRGVASSVAEIGAEAKRAGLSAKAFQELKFAAEQSHVTIDAMTDGMKELSLRTDEFIVSGGKTGSAAEAFQRLGFTVDELKTKIKDPSALLTEIIGKVQSLDKAAQVRIFDELFGGEGGEQFVRFIDAGEQGLRASIKAANDLGIVMDDSVIARAAEVDRQFNLIATTIGSNLKAAIVDAFSALAQFVDSYRSITEQTNATLDRRVTEIGSKRIAIETKILELQSQQRENVGALSDVAKNLGFENSANTSVSGATGQIEAERKALQGLADEERALVEERNKRVQLAPLPPLKNTGYSGGNTPPPGGGGGTKTGSKGGGRSNELETAIQRVREHTAELEAEAAAQAQVNPLIDDYGYTIEQARIKQELLTAAQRAGIAITPGLAASIEQLATGYAQASVQADKMQEAQDRARQSAEDFRSTSKDVVSGFISDLRSGTSAAEALSNALDKVLDRLLETSLNSIFGIGGGGGGGKGGLLGGFLIPGILHSGGVAGQDGYGHGRAVSPSVFAGAKRYHKGGIAGLQPGEVPAILQRGEVVIPRGMKAASRAQNVHVTVGVSADGNGNLMPFVESVSQGQVQKAAPRIVQAANKGVVPTMAAYQNNKAGADWR